MNNEIGRKITSLTLMTIMLAGGMVIAAPGMVPMAHAANANLFVSAENSQFDNYMSGPQVIEVVVIDSDINDTDQAKGEPDVTVNGKILRMVQAVDGNWYGYFADRTMAQIADSTSSTDGQGLDFGGFCSSTTAGNVIGISLADTNGVAVPIAGSAVAGTPIDGSATGASITNGCTLGASDGLSKNISLNVVREAKNPNANPVANTAASEVAIVREGAKAGQIGIDDDKWPFIQLYTLNPTGNVVVQYNKGGGAQSVTLTFDTVDNFAGASLDRAVYPKGAQVHATITDLWLNIDPTDEDSWTFATTGTGSAGTTHYQVFDENGAQVGDTATNTNSALTDALDDLMCEDNCRLITTVDVQGKGSVITLQDNDDSAIKNTATATAVFTDDAVVAGLDVDPVTELNTFAGETGNLVDGVITITEDADGDFVTATFTDDAADGLTSAAEITGLSGIGTFVNGAVTITQTVSAQSPLAWSTEGGFLNGVVPVTITEQGPNSGVFGSYDESDDSNIVITTGASRGTSAAIDYNESAVTILVGHSFGSVDIQPTDDEWNSGEEIPVVISDGDINLNSRADEDMDLNNPAIPLIPTLQTGDPFTLAENNDNDDAVLSVLLDNGLSLTSDLVIGGAAPNIGAAFTSGEILTITSGTSTTSATALFTDGAAGTVGGLDAGELKIITGGVGFTHGQILTVTSPDTTVVDSVGNVVLNDQNLDGSIDNIGTTGAIRGETLAVEKFSKRAILTDDAPGTVKEIVIDLDATADDLFETVQNTEDGSFNGFNLLNLDVRSFGATGPVSAHLLSSPTGILNTAKTDLGAGVSSIPIATGVDRQSLTALSKGTADATALFGISGSEKVGLLLVFGTGVTTSTEAFVADFFSYGFSNDGLEADERVANQIIRIEAEETGDNTGTFEGALEYVMINQLNINDVNTYTGISPIANDPSFIVIEDLTDEDSPRVNYLDLGADGVSTQVADQEEAPSHSGIVSFDLDSYKNADTVVITLQDLDLNVDSDLIDIYTVVTGSAMWPKLNDVVGDDTNNVELSNGENLGRLLDVTFDDQLWTTPAAGDCLTSLGNAGVTDTGLGATGFTLVETGSETGVFVGDFQIPAAWCRADATASESVTGLDIEVNYVDFRDASGEIIEVGDSAGVRANTGSVSLDRTVYPVPFGIPDRFATTTSTNPDERSLFPIHQTGMNTAGSGARAAAGLQAGEFLEKGGLTVHVRVNDPDFDISASGEDSINANTASKATGPVKLSVIRGASTVVLGYAGGPAAVAGVMDVGNDAVSAGGLFFSDLNGNGARDAGEPLVRQFGPIDEIAPDAGIFESDILIRYTDGPASSTCPVTSDFVPINGASAAGTNPATDRFDTLASTGTNYCILQGDILQVEYTDPADASGDVNTVTDSATFDLRNGVLQSDKSVYIIGSDMILTLIEPDLDLDNDQAETYDLDLIEWDSDAATVTMGDADGSGGAFDPEPLNFRETGDSTGIFQIVIEIPQSLDGDNLERGEEIVLEYTDWGPSGADYVGNEDEDVNLTIFTSNFGATVELDQKVYTWTDKVYITIVAPDHNFDGNLVDEIGNTAQDPIKVSTRGFDIDNYKLVETGTDTGIFTGEVILTGFAHDADGIAGDDTNPRTQGSGPTDGFLQTDDDDGLTVSFEFSEDETVVGSSLIRWNIGEVQWLEASYPASGTGVIRVIDPDMNLDPEAVDNFDVDVWSDSDAGGIDLTVTETNEATGIFEGTVFFTVTDESSGHRLRVAEGDTVTAEYEDNTLPDPYTTADELDITATSLIGTVVPPLERAPAANLRTVDAFGNSLDTVSVDQQVQISADLANGQDREQSFAYLVQIQDGNGVTVSLAWITGSLSAGQSFSPALSWIPTQAGTYTATAFVWESVDNPTALSPPVSTTVTVQ